jgi:hypothetical protein
MGVPNVELEVDAHLILEGKSVRVAEFPATDSAEDREAPRAERVAQARLGLRRESGSPAGGLWFASLPLKLLSVSYVFRVGGNEYSLPSLVVAVAGLPRVGT